MIKIGITGSIAMGKTTIAKVFKILRIPVHNSDTEVKHLLEKNKLVFQKIKRNWPEAIYKSTIINKEHLRQIVFSNKTDKLKLEQIIHPLVNKRKKKFELFYKKKKTMIAFDIPLLYETKQKDNYDYIFLAVCKESTQLKRALKRKTLNVEIFKKIKKSQFTVQQKIKYNPIIINTDYPKLINFVKILYTLMLIKCGLQAKNGK